MRQCVEIFSRHKFNAEILAASIRNARQVRDVALAGADIATIPFKVLNEMIDHHKTQEGMIKFTQEKLLIPEYLKILYPRGG